MVRVTVLELSAVVVAVVEEDPPPLPQLTPKITEASRTSPRPRVGQGDLPFAFVLFLFANQSGKKSTGNARPAVTVVLVVAAAVVAALADTVSTNWIVIRYVPLGSWVTPLVTALVIDKVAGDTVSGLLATYSQTPPAGRLKH